MICKGCFGEKEEWQRCPHCGYGEGDPGKDAEAFEPGTVLGGRYLLGNVINASEQVLTYKGYDRLLDQIVFIRQKREDTTVESFLQKARWFSYFEHNKNIIDIYDYREIAGKCFMILQYVQPQKDQKVASESVQTENIGVKEEDILVSEDGEWYITDFEIEMPYKCKMRKQTSKAKIEQDEASFFLPESYVLKERYEILEPLGKGGFGMTYLALDRVLERLVAIKEYMPSEWAIRDESDYCVEVVSSAVLEGYQKALANFRNEAVFMARLNDNPVVANVYDYFADNETAYIVMEYVEGENVGKFGKLIGGFQYEAAKDIFIKLLEAVKAIHEKGIVHEDISPGNIILNTENQLKMIDFGSAHQQGTGICSIAEMMIKPGYAAIEQYDEEYVADVRTDIYQAAATFYMLLTGEKPLEASDRWKEDTMKFPRELGVEMPEEEEAILRKALAVLPESRFSQIEEVMKKMTTQEEEKKYE